MGEWRAWLRLFSACCRSAYTSTPTAWATPALPPYGWRSQTFDRASCRTNRCSCLERKPPDTCLADFAMSTPETRVAESDPDGMPVQVRSLTKLFGTRAAVAGLTLAVGSGSTVGLVGGNGGGKTTALRMIAGLLPFDSGGGRILGYDLKRQRGEIRKRVGYTAQRFSLYADLSVRENLRFRAEVYAVGGAAAATEAVMEQF